MVKARRLSSTASFPVNIMLKGYCITVCGVRVYHPLRSTLTGGQAAREIAANAVFASTAAVHVAAMLHFDG